MSDTINCREGAEIRVGVFGPSCFASRRRVPAARAAGGGRGLNAGSACSLQQPVGADVEERLLEGLDDLIDIARRVRRRQEEQVDAGHDDAEEAGLKLFPTYHIRPFDKSDAQTSANFCG